MLPRRRRMDFTHTDISVVCNVRVVVYETGLEGDRWITEIGSLCSGILALRTSRRGKHMAVVLRLEPIPLRVCRRFMMQMSYKGCCRYVTLQNIFCLTSETRNYTLEQVLHFVNDVKETRCIRPPYNHAIQVTTCASSLVYELIP